MDATLLQRLDDIVTSHAVFRHVTHVNPDADGLGSALAMSRHLRALGKDSEVVIPSPLPRRLAFLASEGEVRVLSGGAPVLPADAVTMLYDISTLDRLGALAESVRRSSAPVVVFDHHDGTIEFECLALVEETAGATAQVIFDVLDARRVPITADIALPLYVAIVSDTGSFNYGKTTPHTHRVAARLLEAGLDPLAIHGRLEGGRTLVAVRTGAAVLSTLEVDAVDPRIAHATMTAAQFAAGGADALEMLDLVNHTIAIEGVQAGALFIENAAGSLRLSLRSRGGTSIVGTARHFGGGGHENAAGATLLKPLAAGRAEALARLRADIAAQHGPPHR